MALSTTPANPCLPWIRAARPKTLPAAAIPVFTGGALAHAGHAFAWVPWSLCLLFALLIQIGTNYANDYYDFLKGADDERRIGPQRAVAAGWIRPERMRLGMWITFVLAFLSGLALIPFGGWMLLLVGVVSVLCGIAYTGGPYPLGYNGLGDVFVFIFFGWVATLFTHYVQAGTFVVELAGSSGSHWAWVAGIVPGALATNLLVVNNVRDEPLDREAGKRTLAVRYGRRAGLIQYAGLNTFVLLVGLEFALLAGTPSCLLVFGAAPLMVRGSVLLGRARNREAYQRVLGLTALTMLVAGGLFATGLVLSA